jgi:hypothetical protein
MEADTDIIRDYAIPEIVGLWGDKSLDLLGVLHRLLGRGRTDLLLRVSFSFLGNRGSDRR